MKKIALIIQICVLFTMYSYSQFNATINNIQNVTCIGRTDGSITANPTGGYTPYTYQWSTNPIQTTKTATGLSVGSYTVTVTDAISNYKIINATVTETNINIGIDVYGHCYDITIGYINASGGKTPYTYNWSDGITELENSNIYIGSDYSVTVTDANNCSATFSKVLYDDHFIYTNNISYYITSINTVSICSVSSNYQGIINIPSQITLENVSYTINEINSDAFYSCNNLTSIEVSSDNQYYSSFDGVLYNNDTTNLIVCPKGKSGSVSIPKSVLSISSNAFNNCYNLTEINVAIDNPNYSSIDGILYNKNNTNLITCPRGKIGSVSISNSVTSINSNAFINCYNLTAINVSPDNPNYSSISGILYNKDTTTLILCPKGKTGDVSIPNSVNKIDNNAFSTCQNINSVIIPKSVANIGNYAFYNCSKLTSIKSYVVIPPTLSYSVFENTPKNIPLYVPNVVVNLYKQTNQWKDFIVTGFIPTIGSVDYVAKGNVYLDENENGIKDNNEFGLQKQKLLILPDSVYTNTENNGDFYFRIDSGKYEFKIFIKNDWKLTSDSSSYTVLVNNKDTSGLDFGIKGIVDTLNLKSYITSLGGRCSESSPFFITYKNEGTITGNGYLTFYPDEKLKEIILSDPTYDSLSSDTSAIYWSFSDLRPYEERRILLRLRMPDFTSMGDTLESILVIKNPYEVGEFSDTSKIIVRCSYDPNDKAVYPEGVYDEKFVLMNEPLSYTIRFQNTGNDTAYQVVIIDTLCHNLDLNTFEVLASSHNLQTSYTNSGIVEFRFDSIMLVDSTRNEPLSHGFVKYRIKAKSGLEDNTVVNNTAYIYFDYNPPVVTNTTMNTLTYNIEKDGIEEKTVDAKSNVKFYPNPFNQTAKLEFENRNNETYQLQITDITGKLLQTQQSKSNVMVIEKGKMQSGMYFYKLQNLNTKESFNGKFVIE